MDEIQSLRKKLTTLITEEIKPIREKLDELLNTEAEKICPFSIGDIITLENNKKGKIDKIMYCSLDYNFSNDEDDFYSELYPKIDEIDYVYAYNVDDEPFSITWSISGLRMIQNDTKVGKIVFRDITPIYFEIDKENKSVKRKKLRAFIDNEDFFKEFESI